MGTKNNPGDYDCYAAARPDEPIFTLKANDRCAPDTVRHWAECYRLSKELANSDGNGPGELSDGQRRKYDEAQRCADAMEAWWRKEGERMVTVCDACLQASCWHGLFMCSEAQNAGTVDKPVSELRALNLEHSSYWEPDND